MEVYYKLSQEEQDIYETVFTPTQLVNVLDIEIQRAMNSVDHIVQYRYEFAVSGAMRWPWSQEARLDCKFVLNMQ